MSKTVYLHLGDGRCGSSAIQWFGENAREDLAQRGLLYPSPEAMGIADVRGGNVTAFRHDRSQIAPIAETIAEFVTRQEQDRILLSSEYLLRSKPRRLREIVEPLRSVSRVVAIVYLREQREALLSRYAHGVKRGVVSDTLTDHIQARFRPALFDYVAVLTAVSAVFGRENLVVRRFERARLRDGDVTSDIAAVMDVDVTDIIPRERPNASGTIEEIAVMRILNSVAHRDHFDPRTFLEIAAQLREDNGWPCSRELHRLTEPAIMRGIADHYRRSNRRLRREFFPDDQDPVFASSIPDDYEPLAPEQQLSERSVTMLATYLLKALADERVDRNAALSSLAEEIGAIERTPARTGGPSRRRSIRRRDGDENAGVAAALAGVRAHALELRLDLPDDPVDGEDLALA